MEEKQNMETPRTLDDDWRKEVSGSMVVLKLKEGESVKVTFLDEGVKKEHPDFGKSVAFQVVEENGQIPKVFFVKANNFNLLGQIKDLGQPLAARKVEISRKGSKRSDTRYTIRAI